MALATAIAFISTKFSRLDAAHVEGPFNNATNYLMSASWEFRLENSH